MSPPSTGSLVTRHLPPPLCGTLFQVVPEVPQVIGVLQILWITPSTEVSYPIRPTKLIGIHVLPLNLIYAFPEKLNTVAGHTYSGVPLLVANPKNMNRSAHPIEGKVILSVDYLIPLGQRLTGPRSECIQFVYTAPGGRQ